MNKKLLELLDSINNKKQEVKDLVAAGDLENAKKAKEELKNLQEQFDLLKDIEDDEATNAEGRLKTGTAVPIQDKNPEKEFADAARRGFRNSMNEGTPSEGGYTVPEDIQTRINTYREAKASLIDLVDVENVTTRSLSGSVTKLKNMPDTFPLPMNCWRTLMPILQELWYPGSAMSQE